MRTSLRQLLPLLLATGCFASTLDPAPDRNTPGEYGCPGCPDLDIDTFEVQAGAVTFETFSGTLTNAGGDGTFYVAGPGDRELAGTIQVDEGGGFEFVAPLFCGEQLVKCVFENATGRYVLVQRVVTTDCVEPDIRVTLAWDEKGQDFELHLLRPGGRINDPQGDCTWNTCVSTAPDWGVAGDASDDPKKDVDDTGTYGPENVFLAKPVDGAYVVYVEHWGGGADDATGNVTINVKDRAVTIPGPALKPKHVWKVATIAWPGGDVTPSSEVVDCSADWDRGCKRDLRAP